jgi:hypothetical protein
MRRTEILKLVSVACIGLGCVTPTTTGPGTGGEQPVGVTGPAVALKAPPDPTPEARTAMAEANKLREAKDIPRALAALDKVLQLDPDNFDALHDKAWILATSTDPKVRNPQQALALSLHASTNLGKWGLLREERDALPLSVGTGRHMITMGTMAGALAAMGRFRSPPRTDLVEGSAAKAEMDALSPSMDMTAACGGADLASAQAASAVAEPPDTALFAGNAVAVQGYALDLARFMARKFPQAPETQVALQRAEALMKMYKAGQAPTGQEPVAWSNTPLVKLR